MKRNSLLDLNKNIINIEHKVEDNENIKKSKSVYSLNSTNYFGFENKVDTNFLFDFKDNKEEKEKKLKNKKPKKKIKKIVTKKKNSKENIINEINKNESLEKEIISEEVAFKNKVKFIIKIQSMWLSYKSKKKLRALKFIKSFVNLIKNRKIIYIKYFFMNLKQNKKETINIINLDKNKLDELLKKEKKYDVLVVKYEELLKELNEIKNKIAFKQNLNMINNKNQNISINIFPKKENKRKNNFVVGNKSTIQILKEKNKMSINTIFKSSNLFYLLTNMRKFHLKYLQDIYYQQ